MSTPEPSHPESQPYRPVYSTDSLAEEIEGFEYSLDEEEFVPVDAILESSKDLLRSCRFFETELKASRAELRDQDVLFIKEREIATNLERQLEAANRRMRDLETQLQQRDTQIEVLKQRLRELNPPTESDGRDLYSKPTMSDVGLGERDLPDNSNPPKDSSRSTLRTTVEEGQGISSRKRTRHEVS